MLHPFSNLTKEQRDLITEYGSQAYDNFVETVAKNRGLSIDEVEEAAKGRPWCGIDAKRIGLVDELGCVKKALGQIRTDMGLKADEELEIDEYPHPPGLAQSLLGGVKRLPIFMKAMNKINIWYQQYIKQEPVVLSLKSDHGGI